MSKYLYNYVGYNVFKGKEGFATETKLSIYAIKIINKWKKMSNDIKGSKLTRRRGVGNCNILEVIIHDEKSNNKKQNKIL